jgi:hypothetical protein
MQSRKPNNNSFGPFLKSLEADQGQSNAQPSASNGAFPLRIVEMLAERGPLSVADLLKCTRMSVLDLSGALTTMRDLQLVEVIRETDDHDEIVRLTQSGQRLGVHAG